MTHQRIETRCPSCGNSGVLFIGEHGHLTCSWLKCKQPGVQAAIEHLQIERDALARLIAQPGVLDFIVKQAEVASVVAHCMFADVELVREMQR